MANNTSLQDKFYTIHTSLPSRILLPEATGNNFELKPQFINTLPKFHGLESEDAYSCIREFEEVYLMMRIPQLGEDAVRLRFIPFALKDIAKKWLYNLPASSISTWDDLSKSFLRNSIPFKKRPLSLIHISEPTRLLSISYAVFCLKKKENNKQEKGKNNHKLSRISGPRRLLTVRWTEEGYCSSQTTANQPGGDKIGGRYPHRSDGPN